MTPKKIFVPIPVIERLPEPPPKQVGGQQVNIAFRDFGITKNVILNDYNLTVSTFHYTTKQWYAEWDGRSLYVDESKYRDVTKWVTHWLEEQEAYVFTEEELKKLLTDG